MGTRLGRRVIHFANLPIKLLMPSPPFDRISEISLKTIPSATKVEIRRVLESLYGLDVDRVHTLNRDGKKIKRGGFLAAKPDYKKAYVTLRSPLSLNPDLFPLRQIREERDRVAAAAKAAAARAAVVEGEGRSHWLDDPERSTGGRRRGQEKQRGGGGRRGGGHLDGHRERKRSSRVDGKEEGSKFPWSSMRPCSMHFLFVLLSLCRNLIFLKQTTSKGHSFLHLVPYHAILVLTNFRLLRDSTPPQAPFMDSSGRAFR